jgi:DNA-binding CsgD family transcriptional regulator
MDEGLVIYKEAKQIWTKLARGKATGNYSDFVAPRKWLDLFHPGDYYYFIFDIGRSQFEFISDGIMKVLGYTLEEMDITAFLSRIHPDDQPWFLEFEKEVHDFLRRVPPEKLTSYKIRYDFRVRHKDGRYVHVLHQMVMLQHDGAGNPLRSLGIHTSIDHLKTRGTPSLSFIGMEGEPSFLDVKTARHTSVDLTPREKEVLRLMMEGLQSKHIGDRLGISKATVDKHRKNMLHKTQKSTSAELVAAAIAEGWL